MRRAKSGYRAANSRCREGPLRAREWYEQAIALEPRFPLAHSMFGFHFAQLANYGLLPAHEAMPMVRAEAGKALEIAASLPDGNAMLGLVAAIYDYDWHEASRRFERAMSSEPVSSRVRQYFALYYLLPIGRTEEAVAQCARALQEDPSTCSAGCDLRSACGRLDASTRRRLSCAGCSSSMSACGSRTSTCLEELRAGRRAAAAAHASRACALAPWSLPAKGLLAAEYRLNGDQQRADELLEQLEFGPAYEIPLARAAFHACCSEVDAAADWTERAIAERHPALFFFLRAHRTT